MKTSEEAVDFEKEFRPDDVGKEYRTQLLIVFKSKIIIFNNYMYCAVHIWRVLAVHNRCKKND